MDDEPICYVGVKPCGCWVACCSGTMPKKDRAKEVARWIRAGLEVERCTVEEAREKLRLCECRTFVSKADFSPLGVDAATP